MVSVVTVRDAGPVPVKSRSGGVTIDVVSVTAVSPVDVEDVEDSPEDDRLWVTIVWNDPINLMSYVTYVFRKLFGYSERKATKLMLDVHHKGRATVASGTREEMEAAAERLHTYGLWATIAQD
ncbi:ATP-dependent Clp protease adaptor protein ClpS [Parafrankia sp. EAN1pec]|nr:ATP-dependent Clp protease adaptor protein ClpS [Frankia sp. EAN1pec]